MGRRTTRCRTATSPRTSAADRKSTRLNSSHSQISYAVFCLKKKKHLHESVLERHPAAYYPHLLPRHIDCAVERAYHPSQQPTASGEERQRVIPSSLSHQHGA